MMWVAVWSVLGTVVFGFKVKLVDVNVYICMLSGATQV